MSKKSFAERLYAALFKVDEDQSHSMPDEVRENIAPNSLKQVSANALQSTGDQLVNASTVLPWIFSTLGVPAGLTGMLVPIRESGSMLPQAFLTPVVLRFTYRKYIFIIGAVVQALAVAGMTITTATGSGLSAGVIILILLAIFSLGRSLCSIASKDVQGRTIPKGARGQINGLATTFSGLVAITVGLAVRYFGGADLTAGQLAVMLGVAAVLWAGVSAIYFTIKEPADDAAEEADAEAKPDDSDEPGWLTRMVQLLVKDTRFRNFVTVRSLLLVSSLSPPFLVSLSIDQGADALAGLAGFIIASGLASLLGGRIFGRFADRSSRRLMSLGAGVSSGVLIITIAAALIPELLKGGWGTNLFFIIIYFSLTMMHTGVRVGRKTYVVDMATGDQRTEYVAVSNTAMGVILLIVGAIGSALALISVYWTLTFLALLGLAGVFFAARLPEVSASK